MFCYQQLTAEVLQRERSSPHTDKLKNNCVKWACVSGIENVWIFTENWTNPPRWYSFQLEWCYRAKTLWWYIYLVRYQQFKCGILFSFLQNKIACAGSCKLQIQKKSLSAVIGVFQWPGPSHHSSQRLGAALTWQWTGRLQYFGVLIHVGIPMIQPSCMEIFQPCYSCLGKRPEFVYCD